MSQSGKKRRHARVAEFDALINEHESALLRYATRILRDENAAQDVVQNAFLKLFRSLHRGVPEPSRVSGWLYRVTHNCAVDYLRKESRRRQLHIRHSEQSDQAVAADRGEGFRISEAAARAAEVLRRLSLREQQLVILKVYEEKSYREISEITGLTVSNVGYILHHAMKKMAAMLREENVKRP